MSVDVSLISYFASPIDNTDRGCLSRTCGSTNRGSIRRAIVFLLLSMLSPGCMVFPLSFKTTGLGTGLITVLLSSLISYISLMQLSSASYHNQIFDYYNLNYSILGRFWGNLIGFLMILHYLIITIAYQSLLCHFLPFIFKPFALSLTQNDQKLYTLALSNVFITLPLSMFKDLEGTIIPKLINFIGLGYVFIINICEWANDLAVYRETWYSTDFVTVSSFAVVFASYCGYSYLPIIEGSLYEPTNNRMRKVMRRSLIFLTMIYGPLSFFTYFASINPNGNWFSISAEMILVFTLISTIPCTVVTMRNMIFDIFEYDPSAFV